MTDEHITELKKMIRELKNMHFDLSMLSNDVFIAQICDEMQVDLLEMEVMPDHMHLLLEVDPQFGIHKAVKTIKGRTSHVLRNEFKHLTTKLPSLWTNSYFVSTVGGAPLSIVKQYIESQKTSQRG